MDNTLLIVNAIALLYHESRTEGDRSTELLREVVTNIKLAETAVELDWAGNGVATLRSLALQMCNDPADTVYDAATLLQKFRVVLLKNQELYTILAEMLVELPEDERKTRCIALRKFFKDHATSEQIVSIIREASRKVAFEREGLDLRALARDITGALDTYTTTTSVNDVAGVLKRVNFTSEECLSDIIKHGRSLTSTESCLKTGWQCLNRMTGEHDGLRRGEFVLIGALQHKNKSGFTLSLFKDIALNNEAKTFDPNKKPMLLHFTAENEAELNTLQLYAQFFEQEFDKPFDPTTDEKEVARYVASKFAINGWHAEMLRINPSEFTYHDIFDIISAYEADGYEIAAVVFDYLNMISKKGCVGQGGSEIRDLFRRVRNFTSPRQIAFITPHQLSPDAKMILRQSPDNFVKEIVGKGYWDGCKGIDQEVDLELIIHIEIIGGVSYQVIGRGKHRKVGITPEEHLFTYLPFAKVGGLIPDVKREDRSLKSLKGLGNDAWW